MGIVARTLAIFLAGGLGGSGAEDPRIQFGRRGEHVRFDIICRSEALALPAAFAVAEFIVENGGRTCFSEGRGLLFVPERAGRCARPSASRMSKASRIPWQEAEAEVIRCSAFGRPSASQPTGVVVFQPNALRLDAEKRFDQFMFDAIALTAYDMLPVTHAGAANGIICMEGPDAGQIARRVRDADIADPDDLLVSVLSGSCRDQALSLTGSPWPEVVPAS